MFRKRTVAVNKLSSINNNSSSDENDPNENNSPSWWDSRKIFEWLPAELFYDILSYLEAPDVSSMSCVCKAWRTMMADCYVWKIMCERQGWKVNPAALDKGYKYLREMCKEGTRIQRNWSSSPIRTVVQTVPYKSGTHVHYSSVCFDDEYFYYAYRNTVGLSDCWDGVPFAPVTSHKQDITSICKLRDSNILFSASTDGFLKWWQVKSKCQKVTSQKGELPKSPLHEVREAFCDGPIASIACDHLDALLVSATDNCVKLWDVETGLLKRTIQCSPSTITQVRVNFRQILVSQVDGTCSIWDRHSKLCIQTFLDLAGEGDSLTCCQFDAHPATTVIAGSARGFVREWNTRTGNLIRKIDMSKGKIPAPYYATQQPVSNSVGCIDFTTNAIVIGYGNELCVAERKKGRMFREAKHTYDIASLCCDQSRIVTCGKNKDVVRVWDFNYSNGICEWCKDDTVIFEESNFLPWRTFGRPKPSPIYCLVCRTLKGSEEFSKRKNKNSIQRRHTISDTSSLSINNNNNNSRSKDDKCIIS